MPPWCRSMSTCSKQWLPASRHRPACPRQAAKIRGTARLTWTSGLPMLPGAHSPQCGNTACQTRDLCSCISRCQPQLTGRDHTCAAGCSLAAWPASCAAGSVRLRLARGPAGGGSSSGCSACTWGLVCSKVKSAQGCGTNCPSLLHLRAPAAVCRCSQLATSINRQCSCQGQA